MINTLRQISIIVAFTTMPGVYALEYAASGTNQLDNAANNMQVEAYKNFVEAFILNYKECATQGKLYSANVAKKCVQTIYDEFIASHNACTKQGKIYNPNANSADKCLSAVVPPPPPTPVNLDSINAFITNYSTCANAKQIYTPGLSTKCSNVAGATTVVNPNQTIIQQISMLKAETLNLNWENVGVSGKENSVSTVGTPKLCVLNQVTYSGIGYDNGNGRVFCKLTGSPGSKWTMTGKVARGDVTCEATCYNW